MILTSTHLCIQPSEIAENTAAYIARRLPDYLDRRAYVVVNGAVPETTALLGKVSCLIPRTQTFILIFVKLYTISSCRAKVGSYFLYRQRQRGPYCHGSSFQKPYPRNLGTWWKVVSTSFIHSSCHDHVY